MSNTTVEIVYIGEKPVKRDTVTGSRLMFPRFEPVPVEKAIALQLLEYPTVWRRAEDLEKVERERQAAADAAAEEAERLAAEEAERLAAADMHVGELDLGKMSSAKLQTLAEAEDLGIKQEPQEKVDDFRVRVRDALRAKQSNA
ncbi:hypothetical protein OQ486_09350 [Plesiomonas shigelloides]|uniref:hypothetical protein n=1 Tax=Plesiomonas shigelloides TaxID=703 RepID=UPI0022450B84|nr:hypothetical protein [Plesiomonas shigelloides]MCX2533681.1 hypothetical protein [Plesiomonas shigelloides]